MNDWIEQDLQQNDKLFTVAYFHQPPYSKGSHDSDDFFEIVMESMREDVIPVLEANGIDLVVCGHSHVFERSYLVNGHYGNSSSFNPAAHLVDGSSGKMSLGEPYVKDATDTLPQPGTVYIVCGNAGSDETGASLDHPVFYYSDGGSTANGSLVIDVYKNRLNGKYLKADGSIADDFTLLKKNMHVTSSNNVAICEGDFTLLTTSFTGGSDSVSVLWSNGSTANYINVNPLVSTDYVVTVTDMLTGASRK